MDLSVRAELPEEMDDPALDEASYRRCLADLAALNRVTLTHRAVLRWLDRAARSVPGGAFSVLDIGFGQGDLLRAIASRYAPRGWRPKLCGIDLNPRARRAACAAAPAESGIAFFTGDVFAFRPEQKFDFIVTSQFTHHLPDREIVRLLHWLEANAARGWMVTDLHRHFVPFYGFRFLALAMRWHRIVRQDGTVSIARGFRRRDWVRLLAEAGIDAKVEWHLPFRHTVSRLK